MIDFNRYTWLPRLREDIRQLTNQAARQHWSGPDGNAVPYYNYRYEHFCQVEREALHLLGAEGGDAEIVLAAVWVHDRFQPQYAGPPDHATPAAEWAGENLASFGFPAAKVPAVCFAVANHSRPPGALWGQPPEVRIVWDADKLTKIGAYPVVVYLCGFPAFPGKVMTLESIVAHGFRHLEAVAPLVENFYFESSRQRARIKLKAEQTYYAALAEEIGYQADEKK